MKKPSYENMASVAATMLTRAIFDPKGCFPSTGNKIIDYFDGMDVDAIESDKGIKALVADRADMYTLRLDVVTNLKREILASLQQGQVFSVSTKPKEVKRYSNKARPHLRFSLDTSSKSLPLEVKRAFGENTLISPRKRVDLCLHRETGEILLYDSGSNRCWQVNGLNPPRNIGYTLLDGADEKLKQYGLSTGVSRS